MRVLVLATDAFGGHGGIAKYNRDLLGALCAYPGVTEVVAVPRRAHLTLEPLPPKLTYVTAGLDSKLKYFLTVGSRLVTHGNYDIICCTHLNLLPLAYLARWKTAARLALFIYGIDAWEPPGSTLAARLAAKVDAVISISEVTAKRFLGWAGVQREKVFLLPNAVEAGHYGVGGKNPDLLQRYGLTGKTVLLTLGRLAATERYKGVDEVLELLPALAERYPDLAYLIVGDGDDRERLQEKARRLGMGERVMFAGFIPEAEKADHYRLADAYVMPSTGEGFGFVFLEAMACGVPVLGSTLDGSREALRDGELGVLVDPRNREELRRGLLEVLQRPRGIIPPGLKHFSLENFTRRCHDMVRQILEKG
ncbi:MAG: glycosyltransferase family 4 protein [Deltaproteobacteria bacterium]|nr:glycosyltransferase family 4 protein [Deltaproteobacteria bacterium]